jgi:hemoglobin-like flavoprotein
MGADHEILNESLALIAPHADQLMRSFYGRLFADHPEVRTLFPAEMDPQRERLLNAIVNLVGAYKQREDLVPGLEALGQRHARYGVVPEHYPIVGRALLAALAEVAGDQWATEHADAWARAYTWTAEVMQQGATAELST